MGKRILVAVALLLAIAATGCKGVADEVARGAIEVITASRNVPKPVKKALGKLAWHEAKDVTRAACQLKDSSDIDQQARRDYWDRGEYKIRLIVSLAKEAQTNPNLRASCDKF